MAIVSVYITHRTKLAVSFRNMHGLGANLQKRVATSIGSHSSRKTTI